MRATIFLTSPRQGAGALRHGAGGGGGEYAGGGCSAGCARVATGRALDLGGGILHYPTTGGAPI